MHDSQVWKRVFHTWLASVEKKEEVRKHMRASPHTPSRQLALHVGLSHTLTYQETCSFNHPYKISVLQELKPPDHDWCVAFCQ